MESARTPRLTEVQALSLKHSYGFRTDVDGCVHNLSDAKRNAMFFVSGHIGVIYNVDTNVQTQLLGHSNAISSCCVSSDRAYIVTADSGPQYENGDGVGEEPLVIIWNSITATPIRTLSPPSGVRALDLSNDSSLLAVITNSQQLHLYHWSSPSDTPLATHPIPTNDIQTYVRFHPNDPSLLVSNGRERVIFWHTFPQLVAYVPPLASKDFRHPVGNFTQSTFLPTPPSPSPLSGAISTIAASATMDGDVVVWDVPQFQEKSAEEDIKVGKGAGVVWGVKAIKALQLHQGPIRVLTATADHIVTGGEEGFVRFFDPQFRILAWFEDLGAGAITSLSFSRVPPDPYDTSEFKDADFIAATKSGVVLQVQPSCWEDLNTERRKGSVVLQYHDGSVYGVAAHPTQPLFVTVGHSGLLQEWNYDNQTLLVARKFDKLMGHRVAFDPEGFFVAVGFTNGTVRVVFSGDLSDVPQSTHRQSRDCITEIIFSHDGNYLATSDADRCVVLYQYSPSTTDENHGSWIYIGKYRAHTKPITGLIFGISGDGLPRLLSIAEDRTLVEFDIPSSSVTAGLVLKNLTKIEQVAVPTSMAWHPRLGKEDFIIVASDQYKFKLYNSNTKTCRKTVLGPTYGGPLNSLVNIPSPASSTNRYLAYGTHEKVLGLIKLPLDGNPHNTMGLIAHPNEIASMCASHDAQYLFSAGGADGTVFMWKLDLHKLDVLADEGGDGVTPFSNLLERGGCGEAFWTELHDYFYFAQLKSQGEDTMRPRHIGPTVSLAQVPHILRGLGYYPTEREVEDLVNELKFTNFVDTGEQVEEVTLDTIIKAYVNHKPVFGVSEGHLEDAFNALGADETGALNMDYLLLQLQYKGEPMSETEIRDCMRALLGDDAQMKLNQMNQLTAKDFAELILGFESLNGSTPPP